MEQGADMLDTMGQRLKALQRQRDWNNIQVVELLKNYGIDIDPSHYSRLTSDKSIPSVQVAIALAKLFETTTDFILGMEWATNEHRIVELDVFISDQANAVGAMVDKMDDEMRDVVLRFTGEMLAIDEEREKIYADVEELLEGQKLLLSGQKLEQIKDLIRRLRRGR